MTKSRRDNKKAGKVKTDMVETTDTSIIDITNGEDVSIDAETFRPSKASKTKKGGAQKKTFDYERVEELAALGFSKTRIAQALNCCRRTLYARSMDDQQFAQAMERGRARADEKALSKLQSLIDDGQLGAITFYLRFISDIAKPAQIEANVTSDASLDVSLSLKNMSDAELLSMLDKLESNDAT